jgi:hypothetical protein
MRSAERQWESTLHAFAQEAVMHSRSSKPILLVASVLLGACLFKAPVA